ncbi:MAG: response regulator [Phycisphaerae bacterium]|nr:response regulator [Tepidisphaeraceae bacterium]
MAPTKSSTAKAVAARPRVLVVDDEPALLEMIGDTVAKGLNCRLIPASSIAQARKVLESQKIDLVVTDVHLPDGHGISLLPVMHLHQPHAQAIVITGSPSTDCAVEALREGAADFVSKPFSARDLTDRAKAALARAAAGARNEKRQATLRRAVRRLNDARKTVSKKVDLLCNDLINAYGELSKQLDLVRVQESYKHVLNDARDLEQLLCHTMDWVLRQLGYANIAVWLAGDDDTFQLGAYMKYTVPGEQALTDALRKGIVPLALKENLVHLSGDALARKLTPDEAPFMTGHDVLAMNCTYLAESLAVVVLFRDAKTPFREEDVATLKAISPLFALSLAGIVRETDGGEEDGEDNAPLLGEDTGDILPEDSEAPKKKKRPKKDDADWWKRGEAPPF